MDVKKIFSFAGIISLVLPLYLVFLQPNAEIVSSFTTYDPAININTYHHMPIAALTSSNLNSFIYGKEPNQNPLIPLPPMSLSGSQRSNTSSSQRNTEHYWGRHPHFRLSPTLTNRVVATRKPSLKKSLGLPELKTKPEFLYNDPLFDTMNSFTKASNSSSNSSNSFGFTWRGHVRESARSMEKAFKTYMQNDINLASNKKKNPTLIDPLHRGNTLRNFRNQYLSKLS